MAAYNATKAAVINLTRSLVGVGQGQCQRQCRLPRQRRHPDAPRSRGAGRGGRGKASGDSLFAGMVPAQLGRHVKPLEIGRVVAFLLTDAAHIIRGQAINLDGGETPVLIRR